MFYSPIGDGYSNGMIPPLSQTFQTLAKPFTILVEVIEGFIS